MAESEPPTDNLVSWKPIGVWATAGLGFVVFLAYLLLSTIATIPFVIDSSGEIASAESLETLERNPYWVVASTLVSALGGTLLILLIVALRKGVSFAEYLAIHRPAAKEMFNWLGLAFATVVLLGVIGWLLNQPAVPEWWRDVYGASTNLPFLVLAIVIAAPLFEESLFRGFLFTGWSDSKLGVTGTILLTTILWTVIHTQYGAFDLAQVFVIGILLGIARHRSRTLVVPFLMHAFVNALACLQVAYILGV